PPLWYQGDCIGRGAFARVYLGLDLENWDLIAVKQVRHTLATSTTTCGWCACDLRDISHSTLRTEIGLLLSLSHPHIVRCFGYQVTAEQTSIFMEYVPGGSVASVLARLGPFPLAVAKDVTAQLLDALAYLHARGVVHRDVKAANVLLDINGTVKLSDFGESRRLRVLPLSSSAASAASSPPGSAVPPLHAASRPLTTTAPSVIGYDFGVDVWGVGCVLLEMMSAQRPWPSCSTEMQAFYQLGLGRVPPLPRTPQAD
ncbi:hypothetical protein CXG81DRAFT_2718, partial [Caulochytrium protostelioides]